MKIIKTRPSPSKLAKQMTSTGLLTGGVMTVNGGDAAKVDITAGIGQVVDNYSSQARVFNPIITKIPFGPFTAISVTDIATQITTFISIDINGAIIQGTDLNTATERRDQFGLGVISHVNLTSIDSIANFNDVPLIGNAINLSDMSEALGVINQSGNVYSANGANLKIDKSSGVVHFTGLNYFNSKKNPNFLTSGALIEITFFVQWRDGVGGFNIGVLSELDPTVYDDGTGGALEPNGTVSADQWQVMRVYFAADAVITAIQYGQAVYDSKVAAEFAVLNEKFEVSPDVEPLLFRAYLLVRGGATDLSDSEDAVFLSLDKFSVNTGGTGKLLNPTFKSYTFTSQGVGAGVYYTGGFYEAPAADSDLDEGSQTQTLGGANVSHAAHALLVASGAGAAAGGAGAVEIEVSGTSITDAGVRTASDTEIIVADITTMTTDTYYETSKKWLGQVTYTLQNAGGSTQTTFSAVFNYGFAKYEDFGNRNFTVTDFETVGLASANDTGGFNVQLLHHRATGWTYSAAAFVAGNGEIVGMQSTHVTEIDLDDNDQFAFKRSGLTTAIAGNDSEGVIIKVTTGQPNSVQSMDCHIGVEI